MPYKNNLQALFYEPSFKLAVDSQTWSQQPYIIKLGNLAVHTDKAVSRNEAILFLSSLFEFIQWLDYRYGPNFEERVFDENKIPAEQVSLDVEKIRATESLLEQKEAEIQA